MGDTIPIKAAPAHRVFVGGDLCRWESDSVQRPKLDLV